VRYALNAAGLQPWCPEYDEKDPPLVTSTTLLRACLCRDGKVVSEVVEKLFRKVPSP
jgi:hypothetical protein